MSVPTALQSLSPREAVADAVLRAVRAYDTNSLELLESALTEDVTFEISGTVFQGLEKVRTDSFETIGKMDTTHFITNHRIHIEPNGTEAHMTANALSNHYRPGEGSKPGALFYLVGALYDIDLVKQSDEQWKVKNWLLKPIWTQGDRSVMQG